MSWNRLRSGYQILIKHLIKSIYQYQMRNHTFGLLPKSAKSTIYIYVRLRPIFPIFRSAFYLPIICFQHSRSASCYASCARAGGSGLYSVCPTARREDTLASIMYTQYCVFPVIYVKIRDRYFWRPAPVFCMQDPGRDYYVEANDELTGNV